LTITAFYLANAAGDSNKHQSTFYQTRGGAEPEPAYSLRYAEPSSAASKNCYAAALFDPYNSEVLYGEVLLKPDWTQPTLSAEEIRRNGGIPPPPQPLMPSEFTIQLYNPDQQVRVSQRFASLTGAPRWDFSLPQSTFRTPSASALDRTQDDPTADATIPKIKFSWKKEKLSKDVGCYMTGKSTDMIKKKHKKEPDIAVAMYKSLKEITVYEPNLHRCDLEDAKGLEVVLLLGAAVIRDIFFTSNIKQAFNVTDPVRQNSASSAGKLHSKTSIIQPSPSSTAEPVPSLPIRSNQGMRSAALAGLYAPSHSTPQASPPQMHGALHPHPPAQTSQQHPRPPPPPPPITDPRTQWEIDAETARLRATHEAEARTFRAREEARRREREQKDEDEARRLRRIVEEEERARRKKAEEVERETQRLRGIYGVQRQDAQGGPCGSGQAQMQFPGPPTAPFHPQGYPSSSVRPPGSNNGVASEDPRRRHKKSFWNLRGGVPEVGS